jgi:hypothetical protein
MLLAHLVVSRDMAPLDQRKVRFCGVHVHRKAVLATRRVACPRPGVGMSFQFQHAHARPWTLHPCRFILNGSDRH